MDKDILLGLMEESIKESYSRTRDTDSVSISGRTAVCIEENGRRESSTESGISRMRERRERERDSGTRARESSGSKKNPCLAIVSTSETLTI